MKQTRNHRAAYLLLTFLLTMLFSVSANAADYTFSGTEAPDYYGSTAYEDVYGSRYNYGGVNIVDYRIPALEYGRSSTTQTGWMEKIILPGVQQSAAGVVGTGYGVADTTTILPLSAVTPTTASVNRIAFTALTSDFKLSNGAIGRISIPAIGVRNYNLWEGETSSSMNKGLGHFTNTSVYDGNVCVCGHNRGSAYAIGAIKDLKLGDTITYTTTAGTRTYAVTTVAKIANDDWSYLGVTSDNRITLITCVAGDTSQRWVVQAVMK